MYEHNKIDTPNRYSISNSIHIDLGFILLIFLSYRVGELALIFFNWNLYNSIKLWTIPFKDIVLWFKHTFDWVCYKYTLAWLK